MDEGILLLRILLGALMAGHALQKLLGWFDGLGIDATATLFESWGLRPGRAMVLIAATTELLGAVLIATGTLTAAGTACVVGTMLVAASTGRPNGIWAVKGGFELPMVYGFLGLGIGLVGPGSYSVDEALGLLTYTADRYVLAGTALAVIGASPLIVLVARTQARAHAASDAHPVGH